MITIVEYDPAWPSDFDEERGRLGRALGDFAPQIEHGGSTSVPGLAAKPVIDIFLGAREVQPPPECVAALERLGYRYFGEFGLSRRAYFHKSPPLACNVHMFALGDSEIDRHLLFRDYLRAHQDEAAAYAAVKRALAAVHTDGSEYARAKTEFIRACERRALEWRNSVCASR